MEDGNDAEPMVLAPSLMVAAAAPLAGDLARRRGTALSMDASEVEHVGGLCLQVLLAARNTWAADGHPFEIAHPSDAFSRDLALLGCPIGSFPCQGETG